MKRQTKKQHLSPKLLASVMVAAVAGFGSSYAVAQTSSTNDAQQRYQAEAERCRSGQTSQDQQTCLREAGAALEEARRNRLTTGSPSFDQNQRMRCDSLSGAQREDCMQLMSDPNATVRGSIDGGGVIRQTTITVPGDSSMQQGSGGLAPAGASPAPAGSTMPATSPGYGPGSAPYTPSTGSGGLAPGSGSSGGMAPSSGSGGLVAPAPAPTPMR